MVNRKQEMRRKQMRSRWNFLTEFLTLTIVRICAGTRGTCPLLQQERLKTCSSSYCEAVIGTHALLFMPLSASRDRF